MMKPSVRGWAEFSEEKLFPRCRFALGRTWDDSKGLALYSGLNPSRAGADNNDMTVTKGMGFARAWGLGGTIHVNAFPFITPYPELLRACTPQELERNDQRLVELAATAKVVVLAWGAFPQFQARFRAVARLLQPFHPICLGRTLDGYPKHISRIGYATATETWFCQRVIGWKGSEVYCYNSLPCTVHQEHPRPSVAKPSERGANG